MLLRRALATYVNTLRVMPVPETKPRTLYDKIYDSHIVHSGQGDTLLYCDRHIVHDVTSPQAFEGLREAKRKVRRPDLTLATADHNVPTSSRHSLKLDTYLEDPASRAQCARLAKNAKDFGVSFFGLEDNRQGIVHIIGPEQGFTLPGTVVVCGDSHSSTHGAFGALALGLGTSEVEHVLATQTIPQAKSKNMRISVDGELAEGVTAKDIILHIIGVIGTAGGTGSCIEYAGTAIRSLSMEGRMTVCNMSIEAGARAGIIQPDEKTIEYLRGRPLCPSPGEAWDQAVAYWSTLRSDPGAVYDIEVQIRAEDIPPTVTWGTSPQDVVPITGSVPDESIVPQEERKDYQNKLDYMGLTPGTKMEDIPIDKAFLGSCTNGRIEDLRSAAQVILASARNGGPTSVAKGVYAMVVPGSGVVKRQAEAEGLDQVFKRAGFDWREAGCSMCLGMNPDALKPRERCASTSNRNFEGRQGAGGRTHLMSPAMAIAAALTGRLADVRTLLGVKGSEVVQPVKTISTAYLEPMTLATHPMDVDAGKQSQVVPESVTSNAPTSEAGFTRVKGFAAPFTENNIDTDKMVPKQFLKTLTRSGLGSALFFPLRYDPETKEEVPDFVLNRDPYRKAQILVSKGKNFAIGSAREHAAWATKDFGIRCVIAPSIGETYVSNCYKNGILCLELSQEQVDLFYDDAKAGKEIEVDLESNRISKSSGESISFEIPAFRRHCLLNGLDDIALTLQHQAEIGEYERQRAVIWPWLDDMSQSKRGGITASLSSAQKQTSW